MLRSFEPRYIPPDRSTISRHYIPEMYEKEKSRVMKQSEKKTLKKAILSDLKNRYTDNQLIDVASSYHL